GNPNIHGTPCTKVNSTVANQVPPWEWNSSVTVGPSSNPVSYRMRCAWSPSSSLVGHQANTHDSPPQHWEEPHPESRSAADNQDSPYDNPAWERATSTTVQVTSRWLNRGGPMLAPPEASTGGGRVSGPWERPAGSIA